MRTWLGRAVALLAATQLAGCAAVGGAALGSMVSEAFVSPELRSGTPFIPNYVISDANVRTLRSARKPIQLGEFSRVRTDEDCRSFDSSPTSRVTCALLDKAVYCGTEIRPGGEQSFSQYLQSAFNQELVAADRQARPNGTRVSIGLRRIEVHCFFGHSWELEVIVTVGDRAPYVVKTVYSFEGAFSGALRYQRARHGFVPAVQKMISEVINHPTFRAEYGMDM